MLLLSVVARLIFHCCKYRSRGSPDQRRLTWSGNNEAIFLPYSPQVHETTRVNLFTRWQKFFAMVLLPYCLYGKNTNIFNLFFFFLFLNTSQNGRNMVKIGQKILHHILITLATRNQIFLKRRTIWHFFPIYDRQETLVFLSLINFQKDLGSSCILFSMLLLWSS